jgi:hypothetical protein
MDILYLNEYKKQVKNEVRVFKFPTYLIACITMHQTMTQRRIVMDQVRVNRALTLIKKWGHLRELRSNSQGVPIYQGEEGWEIIGRCP